MNHKTNPDISNMDAGTALPRRSGELVFHDQWERRAFALAVTLCEQGHYHWDEFREHLISEIQNGSTASSADVDRDSTGYYEHWLNSFEKLLREKGICAPGQLNKSTAAK